ncbi:unnamed protein product [Callosobruchus maculatus]|uniref:C2H2-type domain-containing protein n=1 Tax=Callosobruchus maculatus TaxID=64391 RepID=A0A653D583_CALMS|nr:unnamed protein product [Callosobruchus maculatus]
MDPQMCMICGISNTELFNVYTVYGKMNRTVYDNFQEIYGSQVMGIIEAVDCICERCAAMLDNVAKLKRCIWNIICSAMKRRIAQKFDKILHIFASVKMDVETDDPFDLEELDKASRGSTPQNNGTLLQFTHFETYNKALEDKIAADLYQKSKHGHKVKRDVASRRGRRKSTASLILNASICSETGNSTARSASRVSRTSNCFTPASCVSETSLASGLRRSPRCISVEYDENGRLQRKRTRSVSRAQEEEKLRLELLEGTKYYCDEEDCGRYFTEMDTFNLHKKIFHNALALHICPECKNSYISAEHLQLHSLTHDNSSFFCLMCGVEMPNSVELQKHLDKHLDYSVPCKYCDKSFLSESARSQHYKVKHRKSSDRRLYRSKKLIVDRVDFKSVPSGNKQQESAYSAYIKNNYHVPELLDVNVDNLNMMNISVYTEDDIRSAEIEQAEIEETSDEESYSQLLTSSVMLEDHIDQGEDSPSRLCKRQCK